MTFDNVESSALSPEKLDVSEHLNWLNKSFKTAVMPVNGVYFRFDPEISSNLSDSLGIKETNAVSPLYSSLIDSTRQMLRGTEQNGFKTTGLLDISKYKLNTQYYEQNLNQQSGFAAEIISTYKENLINQSKGLDLVTKRADDLPSMFKRNDEYVDKVRMNANGDILERIQTKFVGRNGEDWVCKMTSSKFDKYYNGKVDKLECPNDYYDDAKQFIQIRIEKLQKQQVRVTADGKTDIAGTKIGRAHV